MRRARTAISFPGDPLAVTGCVQCGGPAGNDDGVLGVPVWQEPCEAEEQGVERHYERTRCQAESGRDRLRRASLTEVAEPARLKSALSS